jgi:curved DNA-binding protein CbpA
MTDQEFIDFYELMQISPNAEPETIQRVYRMLAARYHPDNPHTGDTAKFVRLNNAYAVLSRRQERMEYDAIYRAHQAQPMDIFNLREFAAGIDGENNRRMGILCLLYSRRRTNVDFAGMSILDFETLMSTAREHLMFSLWYLKEKSLIRQDEKSDFNITGEGVDEVERNLPDHRILYNLLKAAEDGASRSETGMKYDTASTMKQ